MKHFPEIVSVDQVRPGRAADCVLFLDLAGSLRLSDAQGADLTPNGRKAQGLLALLGTSPGLRRSRVWLQDKLWSDRGPTQSAGSLRQCLRRLRAALGGHADCLTTGPGWIAFDSARVFVRTEPHEANVGVTVEFLEGLDIGDPEFEDWLRDQRMFYSERSSRDPAAEAPHVPRRELTASRDGEQIGSMVAAAALAGYLVQRRDWPQSIRWLEQADLHEALRGRHVVHAREMVRKFGEFLAVHGREACERDHEPRRH